MNRILLITNAALVIVVVVLYSLLRGEENSSRQLGRAVAELKAKDAAAAAVVTRADPHEVCRSQIMQLTGLLSNSAYQLEITRARLRDFEDQTAAVLASAETGPTSATRAATSPPKSSTGSNALSRPSGPQRFETLPGRDGQVLGRNLEFSAVYGRRVAFKEIGTLTRIAFDVEQLDPRVLEKLGIDIEAQKAAHARQELAWRQAEAAALAYAAAEQQKRQERLAAAEAARLEAEKQQAEQMAAPGNATADPSINPQIPQGVPPADAPPFAPDLR